MNASIRNMLLAGTLCAAVSGCQHQAEYVNSSGDRTLTTVGKINIRDWTTAAEEMTQSLIDNFINTGIIKSSVPGEPAIMAISRIDNKTSEHIDMDMLVKPIRVNLNRTGKVITTTTLAYSGVEDPLAKQLQEEGAWAEAPKSRPPDYTLSGKIIEDRTQAGRTSESTYTFQLSLTDRNGLAVWEEQKQITKQGRRASVGW